MKNIKLFILFTVFFSCDHIVAKEKPTIVMVFCNEINGIEADTFMMLVFEEVKDSESAKKIVKICEEIQIKIKKNGPVMIFEDYKKIISEILPVYKKEFEDSGASKVNGIFPQLQLEFEIFKKKSDTLARVGTAARRGFLFTKISLPFEYLQKNTLCPTR